MVQALIDIFEVCRQLDMVQIAEVNGFEVKHGFVSCPFHGSDTTPSLKLYSNSWYCYGCGEGGDAVTFISKLYNLTPLESVRRLNSDFHLNLNFDRPQSPQERRKIEAEARRRKRVGESRAAFTAWRSETLDRLNASFRVAHEALLLLEDPDKLTEAEILAIKSQAYIEYISDLLTHGTLDQQIEVLKYREEVDVLCKRILESDLKTMPTQLIAS